jgi:hypothetical protein
MVTALKGKRCDIFATAPHSPIADVSVGETHSCDNRVYNEMKPLAKNNEYK